MDTRKICLLTLLAALLIWVAMPVGASGPEEAIDQQNVVFTVYFETNGGSGVPVIANTTSSGKLSSLPVPTMSGYTFEGWYTDELEGDKVTYETVFDADTTIYARWRPTTDQTNPGTDTADFEPTDSGFSLRSHVGTLLVAGTVLATLLLLYAR